MEREMKKIGGEGFPSSVDWSEVEELNGIITLRKAITYDGKERRFLHLETENGEVFVIWESKGLFPLFQVKEGVYVEIRNLGMKEMKSGYKMRIFDIYADEGQLKIPF